MMKKVSSTLVKNEEQDALGKKVEKLFHELGRASMCPDSLSYNGISVSESSQLFLKRVDNLYSDAVSDLYQMNDVQRNLVQARVKETRERQMNFDVPSEETVNCLLHDYRLQPYGRRNRHLLGEYNYCQFVLECVAMQKSYLGKFEMLVETEQREKNVQDTSNRYDESMPVVKDFDWLSVIEAAQLFRLPKNNIKSRQWRIDNKFPYDGFDREKGAYSKVVFNRKDIEQWLEKKS